jgi:uncharacterized membrane protein YhaH (DUF805 family)
VTSFATHFYFSSRGRTGRRLYWMFGVVPLLLASIILGFLLGSLQRIVGLPLGVFWLLFGVIGLIGVSSWICIGSRRLHDFNQPGWWMLVVTVLHIGISFLAPAPVAPMFSVVVTTVLGAIPGTIGSNAFGADPNAMPAAAVADLDVRANTSLVRTREG